MTEQLHELFLCFAERHNKEAPLTTRALRQLTCQGVGSLGQEGVPDGYHVVGQLHGRAHGTRKPELDAQPVSN